MGYRPMHPNADVLILEFKPTDPADVKVWKEGVDNFLKPYKNATIVDQMADCNYNSTYLVGNKACKVPLPVLTNCTEESSYGFATGNPCVFLKMNKMFDWVPKPYSYNEISEGVTAEKKEINMPEDLKQNILQVGLYNNVRNNTKMNIVQHNIWVSCSNSDKDQNVTWTYDGFSNDAKMGDSAYADKYPIMGFPTYYYPYNMQDNYLSPFVVVQFFNLPKGETVKMSCQLWGKDIEINRQRRLGMTNIEILSK